MAQRWYLRASLASALLLSGALWSGVTRAQTPGNSESGVTLFDVHATLGVVALSAFATSLVVGSASGNLGKLMDPNACCPDGGTRQPVWRTTDRILVTTGIVAYSSAGAIAAYNLLFREPSGTRARLEHRAHRWLALGHGAAFLTSAITGIIMLRSQRSDPETFARAAQIHTASNVALVPILTLALSNILWE